MMGIRLHVTANGLHHIIFTIQLLHVLNKPQLGVNSPPLLELGRYRHLEDSSLHGHLHNWAEERDQITSTNLNTQGQ